MKNVISLIILLLASHYAFSQVKKSKKENLLTKEKLIETIYNQRFMDTSYAEVKPYRDYKIIIYINPVLKKEFNFYQAGETVIFRGDSIGFLPVDMILLFRVSLYLDISKIIRHRNKIIIQLNLVNESYIGERKLIKSKRLVIK